MGSIGGSRFGSGKPRRLVRRVWKGPSAPQGDSARAGEAWGVTGSVSGWVIRPTSWSKKPRVGFHLTPKTSEVAPNGNEWLQSHGWRAWRQPCRHSRSEMPSAAIRRFRGSYRSDASISVLANGRRRKRESERCKLSARELVDSTGTRDNKSVADTGKRHLPSNGLTALRRGRHGGGQRDVAAHHRDRRAAAARERVSRQSGS